VVYAPCSITAKVAGGREISIREDTNYPFEDRIRFHIYTENPIEFPLHLRIPGWCSEAVLCINGEQTKFEAKEGMMVLDRTWKAGDLVELQLPMEVKLNRWVENSVSVERGPLVYVLKIREKWTEVKNADEYGNFSELRPLDPWNTGLLEAAVLDPAHGFEFFSVGKRINPQAEQPYPWSLENAPVALRTKGRAILPKRSP